MPEFYEFFAGGARAGLGAGWTCRFANDFDVKKTAVYALNWGDAGLKAGDVADVTPGQLAGRADLAWASFPCQDLSLAGAQAGLRGERSGTFYPFWRLMQGLVAEGRGPRIDPEASPDVEAITRATLRDLEAAGWTDRSKIIAFDWQVLRLTQALHPGIATAHLTIPTAMADTVRRLPNGDSPWADGCDPRRFGDSDLAALKAHGGLEWSPHIADVTPEHLAEARELDLRVGPWGVSTAQEIRRLIADGVYSVTVSGPDWGPDPAEDDRPRAG